MPAGTDDDAPCPADAVEVGRIGEAWGVKGWFRVLAHASDPQALFGKFSAYGQRVAFEKFERHCPLMDNPIDVRPLKQ